MCKFSFIQKNVSEIHLPYINQYWIPFYSGVVFYFMDMPKFICSPLDGYLCHF